MSQQPKARSDDPPFKLTRDSSLMSTYRASPALQDVLDQLSLEASVYRHRGMETQARYAESVVEDIQEALAQDRNRSETVAELAIRFECTESHIHSLFRAGRLANLSEPGQPRRARLSEVARALGRVDPSDPASQASATDHDVGENGMKVALSVVS